MKKLGKVILVLIILALIGAIGYGGYYLYSNNEESNKKIGELENKIATMEENKTVAENTTNNQSPNYEKIVPKYNFDENYQYSEKCLSTKMSFSNDGEYVGLDIEEIIKNSDGTYTVRGTACEYYKLNDSEIAELERSGYVNIAGNKCKKVNEDNERIKLKECDKTDEYAITYEFNKKTKEVISMNTQYSEIYRNTEKRMEIILDKDVFVPDVGEIDAAEGKGMSIEEFYNTTKGYNISTLYNFGFKDGKCVEMFPIRFTT